MDSPSPMPPGGKPSHPPTRAPFPAPLKLQGVPPSATPPGPPRLGSRPGTPGLKPLVLPRRINPLQRAQEATQVTSAARKSIGAILHSQPPWPGGQPAISTAQVDEVEKTLRALETKVGEQELAIAEALNKIADRERALAEAEALLQAREEVIEAMRKEKESARAQTSVVTVNPEEVAALKRLKEELDRQEASIKEQRAAVQERETFLEQSEAALFDKMQAQQEKETELEQKEEEVRRAMLRAGLIKAEPPPPMEKA